MSSTAPRRPRLSRAERHAQLIAEARTLVQREGTDALTLGRLAEQAGVTKPVVYDHFETREGLLAALYRDYDARQNALMDTALAECAPALAAKAAVIAAAYIRCVVTERRDIPGVAAALAGAPAMDALKRGYQTAFIAKCRETLEPFAEGRPLRQAALWALLGAADALAEAALRGDVAEEEAIEELRRLILATVERGAA